MSRFRGAPPDVRRQTEKRFEAQCGEADTGAHNVDDGIDGTDFMEMDLFERDIVHSSFGFAKCGEDGGGAAFYFRIEIRLLENLLDCSQRTVRFRVFGVHAHVRGSHAILPNFPGGDFPAGHRKALKLATQDIEWATGAD